MKLYEITIIQILPLIVAILLGVLLGSSPKFNKATTPGSGLGNAFPTPVPETTVAPTTVPSLATIRMTPEAYTLPTTGNGQLDIVVDPSSHEVTAVQLEIKYDPAKLRNVAITSVNTFFLNPVSISPDTVDQTSGIINFSRGLSPADSPPTGPGVFARLTFSKVTGATGSTPLNFLSKTKVTTLGVGTSVLNSATGSTVTIQ